MNFAPEQLVADAVAATGLDDLGDSHVHEGLAVYCEAVAAEASLNDLGVAAVRGNILATLANRLRVVEWSGQHAIALECEQITAPVVIIGLFRAGTTFLSYLLDQDPTNRALLRWEAGDSVPPATPATFRNGPRVEAARTAAAMMHTVNPKFKAIHDEDADGPTECISVMSQDFKSLSWESITNVPSYSTWLFGTDQKSAYEYHHLVLRVLQSGGVRGRWTLKSPHHSLALGPLTAEYPDAKLVLLHRDPLVLCASVCSLISTLSGTFTDADHSVYIAEHWPAVLDESIRRVDAFRDANPQVEILDVHYADLVADPVRTLERIYAASGDELTGPARANVQQYVDSHPKGRFGAHRYDLADLGLHVQVDPAVVQDGRQEAHHDAVLLERDGGRAARGGDRNGEFAADLK